MSTPIAITASKVLDAEDDVCSSRLVEEDPSKSVAVVVVFVCTWEAAIILRITSQSMRALEDATVYTHFEHANGSSKLPGTL